MSGSFIKCFLGSELEIEKENSPYSQGAYIHLAGGGERRGRGLALVRRQ